MTPVCGTIKQKGGNDQRCSTTPAWSGVNDGLYWMTMIIIRCFVWLSEMIPRPRYLSVLMSPRKCKSHIKWYEHSGKLPRAKRPRRRRRKPAISVDLDTERLTSSESNIFLTGC
jgi:hypothetical protein